MNLYIQIENGQPVNHPAIDDNLIAIFGIIPPNWEPFARVEKPVPNVYQVLDGEDPAYEKVNGVWTDVWPLRNMTVAEKTAKQQAVRDAFNSRQQASNWSAWTFDETTCSMVPPIPRPATDPNKINAGIYTFWCGADNNWKDTSPMPHDNNQYNFDFLSWTWVIV